MVISPAQWADWLDPGNSDVGDLRGLMTPAGSGELISYPVSKAVNSVRNNGPALIEPAEPDPGGPGSAGPRGEPPARARRLPRSASGGSSGISPDTLF